MPLDPGRWPDRPADQLADPVFWSARLRAVSLAWRAEAGRLRATVRSPVLSGPCARALWCCADQLAAEIIAAATQLDELSAPVAAPVATAPAPATALAPGSAVGTGRR